MLKDFRYAPITMVLGKVLQGGNYAYLSGKQSANREVWITEGEDTEMEPCEYVIFAKASWVYKELDEFVLTSYGLGQAKIA